MGGKRAAVGVDGYQHALTIGTALKNQLFGLHQHVAVAAIAQGAAGRAGVGQRGDPGGQVGFLGALNGRTQGGVAVALVALHAPLAAVVDSGHAGHTKQQAVDRFQAVFIRQNRCNARYIVVIHKAKQVLAGVQAPLLTAKLAVQAVADLVHVARVEAGIQPLVALVVGHAVAGAVVHPAVVVAVQGLAHQHKIGLQAVGQAAQLGQKAKVQAVGHIQAQAVDVIVPHPVAHGVEQVIFHVRML